MDSIVVTHELSCSVAYAILIPRTGIEPASSRIGGRFFTTGLSGESPENVFLIKGLSVPGSNQSNHLASSGSVLMLVGV